MLHEKLFPHGGRWAQVNLNQLYIDTFPADLRAKPDNPMLNASVCGIFVYEMHRKLGVDHSFGGWLEDRKDIWRGHYHPPGQTIHVGMDYNVEPLTPVHLPFDGKLLCLEHNEDQDGGWGGRAIYKVNGLYVTFAHLECPTGIPGTVVKAGTVLGLVGRPENNGYWYPHLHVQVMRQYDLNMDGYSNLYEDIRHDFPNPEEVLAAL